MLYIFIFVLFSVPETVFPACDVCEQYSKTPTWQSINDKFEFACPEGWKVFNRTRGTYCMKIFYTNYPQYIASAQCALSDAYLPGIESETEWTWLYTTIRSYVVANGDDYGYFWVGGARIPACSYNMSNSTWCSLSSNAFIWGDYYLTGPATILDAHLKGDNVGEIQNCIILRVNADSGQALDDISSTVGISSDSSVIPSGYVCGKPADIVGLKPTCSTS
ncbi:unnamed protein product [Caenorhabditis angaria]|uniref:C-type lectin domain-containing protein n=1 Tax=Caenorhabditis angaria TaxID=860376 RepID=A0A9P1IJY4_9PELO|nr:unnamed protein product [Caenorhabditis angaria]